MRKTEEFWCDQGGGGCGRYFRTFLRANLNGEFTIQCPGCGHRHNRKIVNGLVTSDRCNDKSGQIPIIIGLKATLRDTPWHNDPQFLRSQMRKV